MLAIAALAVATLAPFALAAEGQGDNAAKQPTMAELKAKMDAISTEIAALAATVGNLAGASGASTASIASKLDALASAVTANHAAVVGKFPQQMAVVMTVPGGSANNAGYWPSLYLVDDSSIPGFPSGTVGANGLFSGTTLPVGTYLFELQQPYSDNVLCNGTVSRRHGISGAGGRFNSDCPRVRLNLRVRVDPAHVWTRLEDGFGIYDVAAGNVFNILHKFPTDFAFTDDKPLGSYSAAVRITKLK